MAGQQSRKLAVILHADVVDSTSLVRLNETLAHERIQDAFGRLSESISAYGGVAHEIRGDALVAEFARASDAVCAALSFQQINNARIARLADQIVPVVRVGIALGEEVVADDTVTGAGVVLAQRVEQLSEPGGICVTGAIHEAIPQRMPFERESLGDRKVKGFPEPVRVYRVALGEGELIPEPEAGKRIEPSARNRRVVVACAAVALIVAGGGVIWLRPWTPDEEAASVERMAFPLPDKPSIAVLPFENLSGDASQEYLVDGITETIITELSRFRGLFVIARNSVFAYKGRPIRVQRVAEELGVQYVLEGSMQRSGDRIRITAQLIDAVKGSHLWAENYDREALDIFVVQDEVTQRIVASLGAYHGELAEAARERARRRNPGSISAYEAFQLGIEYKHRFTKEDNEVARELFSKAIELAPQFAQAHVGLAWTHMHQIYFGWTDEPSETVARAFEAARKAIELDPSEAEAHWLLAEAYLAEEQFEHCEAEFQKALALNPNDADLLAGWGYASVLLGEPERAAEFIEKAMRLNPHYPDWYERALGTAAYLAGRYEDAIATFKKVERHVIQSRLYLAASYARLDRLEEARDEVAAAVELDPEISIEKFSSIEVYKNRADLERLQEDLRKAGLSEK